MYFFKKLSSLIVVFSFATIFSLSCNDINNESLLNNDQLLDETLFFDEVAYRGFGEKILQEMINIMEEQIKEQEQLKKKNMVVPRILASFWKELAEVVKEESRSKTRCINLSTIQNKNLLDTISRYKESFPDQEIIDNVETFFGAFLSISEQDFSTDI